jgi:hypothetical protein
MDNVALGECVAVGFLGPNNENGVFTTRVCVALGVPTGFNFPEGFEVAKTNVTARTIVRTAEINNLIIIAKGKLTSERGERRCK